jgi:hypothetical protein
MAVSDVAERDCVSVVDYELRLWMVLKNTITRYSVLTMVGCVVEKLVYVTR